MYVSPARIITTVPEAGWPRQVAIWSFDGGSSTHSKPRTFSYQRRETSWSCTRIQMWCTPVVLMMPSRQNPTPPKHSSRMARKRVLECGTAGYCAARLGAPAPPLNPILKLGRPHRNPSEDPARWIVPNAKVQGPRRPRSTRGAETHVESRRPG